MTCVLYEPLEARRFFTIPGTTLGSYHTYESLSSDLNVYAASYPLLTKLISIGKSVENRDIWALKISDNPGKQEDEPELRYIGALHGDEPLGMENTFYFASQLLENYHIDPRVTKLVDNTEIWIIPNMNPDGLARQQRGNANGVDLNRSFPDGLAQSIGTVFDNPVPDTTGREPETAAMMKFSADHSFNLSINFHAGSVVANYPYDSNGNGIPDNAPTPDDAMFRELALTYAKNNPTMFNSWEFPQGISNGDAWYEVEGGLQDWSYRYCSDNDITVELSYIKRLEESELPSLWEENSESMMQYAEAINWGVRGVVTRSTDGAPVHAKVFINRNSHPVFSDPEVGDYHRMLLPGKYTFTFDAPGYESKTIRDIVVSERTNDASLTKRLDVSLTPLDQTPPLVTAAGFAVNSPAIAYSFSEDVGASITKDDLVLLNESGRPLGKLFTPLWNPDTLTAQFSFTAATMKDGNYTAVLSAAGVRDAMGNRLTTNQSVDFFLLAGDANRDRRVDSQDTGILTKHFGTAGKFAEGDFNYSGYIDSRDFNVLLSRFGKRLPPATTVAAMTSPLPDLFASESSDETGSPVQEVLLH